MIRIQTLGPGDDLGWSWLFPPYYLHSSARASEPTKMIFFSGTLWASSANKTTTWATSSMSRIAEVVIKQLQATQRRLTECANK